MTVDRREFPVWQAGCRHRDSQGSQTLGRETNATHHPASYSMHAPDPGRRWNRDVTDWLVRATSQRKRNRHHWVAVS